MQELGTNRAELKVESPIYFATDFLAPLLVLQGGSDQNVHREHSDGMVAALRERGKKVEYYLFSQERHAISDVNDAQALDAVIEQFLARYLGGRAEPPTPAEEVRLDQAKQ
jgi:dipeptidyl aminopeptidase/acylaminoacyl peptidase